MRNSYREPSGWGLRIAIGVGELVIRHGQLDRMPHGLDPAAIDRQPDSGQQDQHADAARRPDHDSA